MVTDEKDFELLGDPSKMTGYSRPPDNRLNAVTRVLGVCTAVVMMMMFVDGLTIGWSSPYLAQFSSGKSPFPVTVDEISWMASFSQLGGLPGAILGAVCIQYFGTKTVMLGNGCGLLISWLLVIQANSVNYLYVARFICGTSIGVACISFPLYLGDVSSSKIRGASVTFAANGLVIGLLAGNAMGNYLSMAIFACVALVPNVCFLLALLWLPHSPYYLMSKDKAKDAEMSILRYNPKADVKHEMDSIRRFLAISNSMTFLDRLREFNIPRNRKSGFIIVMLCMFAQFSGINAVTSYMESIMTRSMVTVIAPSTVPMIASSLGIIAGWMLMYLTEKCGRRMMWMVSSAGVCVSMTALGIHFYLMGDGFNPAEFQWLPIFSILSFKIFYNIGICTVADILYSELFSANLRTLAGLVSSVSSAIFGFLSIYIYQLLIAVINEAYVWWIHAILMMASVIFGWVFVPEMKGKTLMEIQDAMMKNC